MEWNNQFPVGSEKCHEEVKRHNIDDSKVRKVNIVSIELLEIKSVVGNGTKEYPTRFITEYFTKDGEYLTTIDSCKIEKGENE